MDDKDYRKIGEQLEKGREDYHQKKEQSGCVWTAVIVGILALLNHLLSK